MTPLAVGRAAVLDRDAAMRLAATEYGRFAGLVRDLGPDEWSRPTDCPGWDVRAMAGHVLGMARMVASPGQFVRQNAAAARAGGGVDALTALQVREQAHLTAPEVVAGLADVGPRAARGRRRLARVVGRLPLPEAQAVGGRREWWSLGYLLDVVLTRDTWMHRLDVARATGRDPVLSPDHDGVLVDDVVREWAQRHGRPYRLRLTGPAGGTWSAGTGGEDVECEDIECEDVECEDIECDAVEFCRVLSGRGTGAGLLAQQVPF